MALGETWLPQPIAGWWTLPNFPDIVHAAGRRFRRAGWKQDYDGVAACVVVAGAAIGAVAKGLSEG